MNTLIATLFALVSGLFQQELPHAFPRDGATLVTENERVAVWDVTWIKGKPSPMHQHRYDLVGVYFVGSAIKVTMPDGKTIDNTMNFGDVIFQKRGVTHIEEGMDATNPRRAILIDLKNGAAPAYSNSSGFPAAFPRDGAKKLIDNERVVIWDYRWTPGQPTPMHFHDKDVVVVFLDEGDLKSTTPDGMSVINHNSVGMARFNPGNRTHSEELVKGAARAIVTELK
jgi:quercetin dioxygenase-like cupin family protein